MWIFHIHKLSDGEWFPARPFPSCAHLSQYPKGFCVQDEADQETDIYCALPRCFHCPGVPCVTSFHESSPFSSEFAVCVFPPLSPTSVWLLFTTILWEIVLPRSHDAKSSGRFPSLHLTWHLSSCPQHFRKFFLHLSDTRCPGFPPPFSLWLLVSLS